MKVAYRPIYLASFATILFGISIIAPTPVLGQAAGQQGEWLALTPQSLEIPAGSPLDFSPLVATRPAGREGWLRVSDPGRLVFSNTEEPANFSCATAQNGPHARYEFYSHDEANRYAEQIRRHGYNLLRFQFLDTRFMAGQSKDFNIDPEKLDRFHYLLAALKKNGIYWAIDLMTDPYGLEANTELKPRSPDSIKIRSNFDPEYRDLWLKQVDLLFNVKNPYTGLTTLEDTALALVVPVNESSLAFWGVSAASRKTPFPRDFEAYFNEWARTQYKSATDLHAAIPNLHDDESLEAGTIRLPRDWSEQGARMRVFLRFLSDKEIETFRWMNSKLQERGFHGISIGFHDWYPQLNNYTRSRLSVVDVHGYIGSVPSYKPGEKWDFVSSLDRDVNSYRAMLANRWLDRPFTITEYGQPFWNPYRYEAGVVLPALAALQGVEFICRLAHSSVELDIRGPTQRPRPILPFSIGLDPVGRAGETLAVLLFHRGDVRAATSVVAVPFGEREFSRAGSGNLPNVTRMASLLTRFGLLPDDKISTLGANALVLPLDTPVSGGRWRKIVANLVDVVTGESSSRLEKMIAALRDNGTLSPANITNPHRHAYQSSTNQLFYDGEQRIFSVVTPKTEAVVFSEVLKPIELGQMTVTGANSGALVGASALDNMPLANSKRILFVIASDAINSNMKFADEGRKTLLDWGSMPILIKRVTAEIQLKLPGARNARLTALSLNGVPIGELPILLDKNGVAHLTLDVGAVENSPTTFFLLERSS